MGVEPTHAIVNIEILRGEVITQTLRFRKQTIGVVEGVVGDDKILFFMDAKNAS
jgi:hypothetical protein